MVSFSSMCAIFIAVIVSFLLHNDLSVSLSILILFVFVTYRHKDNIKRILAHNEKKITWM